MRVSSDHRRWAIALWTVGALSGAFFPGTAKAGFFDFLFPPGVQERQAYFPRPRFHRHFGHGSFHGHTVAAHRKVLLAEKADHPARPSGPTNIMDDQSLKRGDAVMTQAGIRIFVGYSSTPHRPGDFRKISEVKKLSQRERKALAALDTPDANSAGQSARGPSVALGRSATERKVTAGETITDPNGRTVRYVGP